MAERLKPIGVIQPDMYRILPSGRYPVATVPHRKELGFKYTQSEKTVANVVNKNSTKEHLVKEFFSPENPPKGTPHVVKPIKFADGGIVTVVGRPAGYFDRCFMVVGSKQDLTNHVGEKVSAFYAADLPTKTRTAYTAAKLAGLQIAYEETMKTGGTPIVVDHHAPASTEDHRLPRTIVLPHSQGGIVDSNHIIPGEINGEHLSIEQKIVQNLSPTLALIMQVYIQEALAAKGLDPKGIEVRSRMAEPIGYGIHFKKITPKKLTKPKTIRYVTAVLDAEHQAMQRFNGLINVLPEEINGHKRKPQPASRQIFHIRDGHLVIATSPIIYSHSGAMEASGVELDRGPDHKKIHSREEIDIFRAKAGARMQKTLAKVS